MQGKLRTEDRYRRTLKMKGKHPTVQKLYDEIMTEGWPYKTRNKKRLAQYRRRDRALIATLYLLCLRVSEVLRIQKKDFEITKIDGKVTRIDITGIKLSKCHKEGKPRIHTERGKNYLPLDEPRRKFTDLILEYLDTLEDDDYLFPFSPKSRRTWQIVTATLPYTCHYLRAYGEQFLYDGWDKDLAKVADYVKVNPNTLIEYLDTDIPERDRI